jgi:hypothetical protein
LKLKILWSDGKEGKMPYTYTKSKESFLIKIYIVLFFLLGIGLWISINATDPRGKLLVDVELDQKINDILFSAGINQADIIKQYGKESGDKNAEWTQYYKTIRLKNRAQLTQIENLFRQTARSSKIGLERAVNADKSITYKFYSQKSRTYSNVTFIVSPPPRGR